MREPWPHLTLVSQVQAVWIARKPPGFGFILMEDHMDAKDACKGINDSKIGGYRMQVQMATNEMKGERPKGGNWVDNRTTKDRRRSRSRSRGRRDRSRDRDVR